MCDKDINCFIQSVIFTSTDAKNGIMETLPNGYSLESYYPLKKL